MPEPRVTFIIPCFNHGRYVGAAVESCLRQERADVRVVIVDDGSDDGSTPGACDALASERVLVLHQPNAGLSAARNAGLGAARELGRDWHGEYVAFLDSDDFIEPTFVRELDAALAGQGPEVSHAYCQERLVELGHGVWKVPDWDPELLLITNLHPVTCLIRWEAMDAVGGFDASMRDGYEDWNLWISLSKRDYRGVRVQSVLFNWRRHSNDTMIFDAVRKHDTLYASIIEKHPELYGPRFETLLKRTNSMIRSWNMNWLDESGEPIPLINLKRARDELVRMREQHHAQGAELASLRAALARAEAALQMTAASGQGSSWAEDAHAAAAMRRAEERAEQRATDRVRAAYERMAAVRFHHAIHRVLRFLPRPLARALAASGGGVLRVLASVVGGGARDDTRADGSASNQAESSASRDPRARAAGLNVGTASPEQTVEIRSVQERPSVASERKGGGAHE